MFLKNDALLISLAILMVAAAMRLLVWWYARRVPSQAIASRWNRLIAVWIGLAGVWLIVLPWIADRPSTRDYLERLDSRGIDPAAMYYTELPPDLFLDAPARKRDSH